MKVSWKQVLILILPFYFNDFLFITFQRNFYHLIVVDYGTRLLVLSSALLFFWKERDFSKDVGFVKIERRLFLVSTFILSVVGVAIDRKIGVGLYQVMSDYVLFQFPRSPNAEMKILDLTVGVGLVAFSEEIVFRGFLLSWLKQKNYTGTMTVLTSSTIFGFMHWASGPHSIINSFIWGIGPGIFVYRYRSLWPGIIAHYVTDVVAFGLYF
jgi:membrane protease YdiL (CAAX protease family)